MMQGLGAPELDSLDPCDRDVSRDAEGGTDDWFQLYVNCDGQVEEARELDVARDDEAASSHRGSNAASSLDGFTIFTPASDAPTQPSSASSLSASPAPRHASSCTSSSPYTGPESSSSPISTTPPMSKAEGPFIFCFPANPDAPNGTKKRRGDFDTHKRKKVAGVREVHACHRCKLKKAEVCLCLPAPIYPFLPIPFAPIPFPLFFFPLPFGSSILRPSSCFCLLSPPVGIRTLPV